jgi:hypothetical protein
MSTATVSIREIATEALGLLETDGWVKGALGGPGERHCIGGALNLAMYGSEFWPFYGSEEREKAMPVYARTRAAIMRIDPGADQRVKDCPSCVVVGVTDAAHVHDTAYIAHWNNHRDTTWAETRDVLCKLAETGDAPA